MDIDFERRSAVKGLPEFSVPKVAFTCIENCELTDEEGTITNLDPNFLVAEDMLHSDFVFPWMHEALRIGMINMPTKESQQGKAKFFDVMQGLGGQRDLREILSLLVKAHSLEGRNRMDLASEQLTRLGDLLGAPHQLALPEACFVVASVFIGQARSDEIPRLIDEARACAQKDPAEFSRFKEYLSREHAEDFLQRQFRIIDDYVRAYDQLSVGWLYAARGVDVAEEVTTGSRDLQRVRMFYGNAFEELATLLLLPACLNNVKNGRQFDTFEQMDLKRYGAINKANRPNPLRANEVFCMFFEEYDSTLRNASHHGAVRLMRNSSDVLEYRSGDEGGWRTMKYVAYVLKCNRIMMCLMRLLALQMAVSEGVV